DSSGQEAMLRASTLAAKRKLELRVVAMPAGTDPAEIVHNDGAEAMAALVEASVPFVRFRVERALDAGALDSPEGRDRVVEELRPVFATLAPSAMRMELTRLVSGRLALSEGLAESLLSAGGGSTTAGVRVSGAARVAAEGRGERESGERAGTETAAATALSRREHTERAFLALCIASPEEGGRALAELDLEESFSSERLRRRRAGAWGARRVSGIASGRLGSDASWVEHTFDSCVPSGEDHRCVDRPSLQQLLRQGMSLAEIAKRFGLHESTVGYWVGKHGLEAVHRERSAARGGLERRQLEALVEANMTIAEIAAAVERSKATVRYWLTRYGLRTRGGIGRRPAEQVRAAKRAGLVAVEMQCPRHGTTGFALNARGYYRCKRCRSE